MSLVGIEAINVFAGSAYVDVEKLAKHRKLDVTRFSNLLMKEKTVALPYEDPITFGVYRIGLRFRQVDEHVFSQTLGLES
jgi:3-carboxymethyl-3-hydroxy-acyl-[acp] synthase